MSDDNKQPTSEEVKAKVIEEYGFNPDEHGAQIDKLTNERLENQKNLSKTIEQKVKYRELGVKNGVLDPTTFEPIEKKPDGVPLINNNTGQSSLSREETIFFAKHQGSATEAEQDYKVAKKIADLEGISILAAMEDDIYKAKVAKRVEDARTAQNSLGASGGSQPSVGHQEKPIDKMTKDEHKEYIRKKFNIDIR